MVDHPLPAKAGRAGAALRAERRPEQHLELPRRGHDLRPRLDRRQSRQPVPRHADRAAAASSGSAIVEFRIPESGKYVMVDHHFANASQGAIGVIDATGGTPEPRQRTARAPQHPGDREPDAIPRRCRARRCSTRAASHATRSGRARRSGLDLLRRDRRRRDERWITSLAATRPRTMTRRDDTAKALLARFKVPMPNQSLRAGPHSQRQSVLPMGGENHPQPGTRYDKLEPPRATASDDRGCRHCRSLSRRDAGPKPAMSAARTRSRPRSVADRHLRGTISADTPWSSP